MNIVQINTVFNQGSTGTIAYDLNKYSESRGCDVYAAYGYSYKNITYPNTFKINSIPELKLSILKTRLYPAHGFYNSRATIKLVNWLSAVKPDVVNLHNIHGHYVNVDILFDYLRTTHVPVVWTLHDCWSFTGWCAHFDLAGCERWKTGCYGCPCKHDYPFTWFFDCSPGNYAKKKKIFTSLDTVQIVTPSRWLEERVSESFLGIYPVATINNGVDLEVFKPYDQTWKNRDRSKLVILGIADKMSKKKGFDYLIRLARDLGDDCLITIVGIKKQSVPPDLTNVRAISHTDSKEELAQLYSGADVYLNPTLEDTFPTTNLEALACGTPVVTFQSGGSPESVGNCGAVVDRGDYLSLLACIRSLQRKTDEVVRSCRERAVSLYDRKMQCEKYFEIYTKLAETPRGE